MPSHSLRYQYDSVGNRTRLENLTTGEIITYTYDRANQLLSEVSSLNGTTTYEYDLAGNRTKKETPSETTFYEWDARNNLVLVEPPSGPVTMVYNCDRQMVRKITPTEERRYLYDGKQLLREYDGNGDLAREYTHTVNEYGDLVSEYDGDDTYYHAYDAQWSTESLVDEAEAAIDRYQYTAFGVESHTSGSSDSRATFVGKQNYYRHDDLELYHLGMGNSAGGGRFYDPAIGQFLAKDPAKKDETNTYKYVDNNPVNKIDPSGQDSEFEKLSAFAKKNDADLRSLYMDKETEEELNIPLDEETLNARTKLSFSDLTLPAYEMVSTFSEEEPAQSHPLLTKIRDATAEKREGIRAELVEWMNLIRAIEIFRDQKADRLTNKATDELKKEQEENNIYISASQNLIKNVLENESKPYIKQRLQHHHSIAWEIPVLEKFNAVYESKGLCSTYALKVPRIGGILSNVKTKGNDGEDPLAYIVAGLERANPGSFYVRFWRDAPGVGADSGTPNARKIRAWSSDHSFIEVINEYHKYRKEESAKEWYKLTKDLLVTSLRLLPGVSPIESIINDGWSYKAAFELVLDVGGLALGGAGTVLKASKAVKIGSALKKAGKVFDGVADTVKVGMAGYQAYTHFSTGKQELGDFLALLDTALFIGKWANSPLKKRCFLRAGDLPAASFSATGFFAPGC